MQSRKLLAAFGKWLVKLALENPGKAVTATLFVLNGIAAALWWPISRVSEKWGGVFIVVVGTFFNSLVVVILAQRLYAPERVRKLFSEHAGIMYDLRQLEKQRRKQNKEAEQLIREIKQGRRENPPPE